MGKAKGRFTDSRLLRARSLQAVRRVKRIVDASKARVARRLKPAFPP
jgi:hypothetical protein